MCDNLLKKEENISQKRKYRERLTEKDLKNLMKKQSIYTRSRGGAFRQKQIRRF